MNLRDYGPLQSLRTSCAYAYPRLKPTSSAKQTAHNYLVQPQHHFLQKGSVSVATLLPGDTGNLHPAAGNFPAPASPRFASRTKSGSRSYLRSASLSSPRDEFAIWAHARRVLWTGLQCRPLSLRMLVSNDFTAFCTVNSAGGNWVQPHKKNNTHTQLDNREKEATWQLVLSLTGKPENCCGGA